MQILSPLLRIGVLRGGPSNGYDMSLQTGANVLKQLATTHTPVDIFISKDGKWHMNGVERAPERILKNIDVVFNALHGTYGEDGQVQEILNHHGVPYTGSDRYASAIAMNKWITKERAILAGIKTPLSMLVRETDPLSTKAKEIFNTIPHPLIVKPACGGSSLGIQKVDSYSELLSALEQTLALHGSAVVEEFIVGREATCGVIDNFRGEKLYSLPPVELTSFNGKSDEICPGNFTEKEKKEIERVAKMIHDKLGLRHYSQSDFVVSPRRGVYFLETKTLPNLTEDSHILKSLKAVGVEIKDFLHHILHLTIHKSGLWI
jgi:D-alanine-D-alanine ligase